MFSKGKECQFLSLKRFLKNCSKAHRATNFLLCHDEDKTFEKYGIGTTIVQ
jgi:hypothetical protein